MTAIPVLTTDRLVLRGWEARDINRYAAMCADAETMRYMGDGKPLSRAEAEARVEPRFVVAWEERGHGHWVVATRDSNDFAGYCALLLSELGTPEATGEVAYGFVREALGKSIATEAAGAAVRWGLHTFGWEQVAGRTHPDNVPSQRVLQKLGMHHAGEWDGRFYRMDAYMNVYLGDRAALLRS